MTELLRILVVDDSAVVRAYLRGIIDAEPDMLVVGEACSGAEAVTRAKVLRPDLLTMDVIMPDLDGVSATREIMSVCPTPIVVVTSAPVGVGDSTTFQALAAGAMEVLAKPRKVELERAPQLRSQFLRQLRAAARVAAVGVRSGKAGARPLGTRDLVVQRASVAAELEGKSSELQGDNVTRCERADVIAIGASTGGPGVIRELLDALEPSQSPRVLVVQHMSGEFLAGFAEWLDRSVRVSVRLALPGAPLLPGQVYVAPGGHHLQLVHGRIALVDSAPVHYQRPAIDPTFESLAASGVHALGVLLTGMGSDGALGLASMRRAGAYTIVQDPRSAPVASMPRAALGMGACDLVASTGRIAELFGTLRHREGSPFASEKR